MIVEFIIPELHIVDINWETKALVMEPRGINQLCVERSIDMKTKLQFPVRFFGFNISIYIIEGDVVDVGEEKMERSIDLEKGQYIYSRFDEAEGWLMYSHTEDIECIQEILVEMHNDTSFTTEGLTGIVINEDSEGLCLVQTINSPIKGNYYQIHKHFLKKVGNYETSKQHYIP